MTKYILNGKKLDARAVLCYNINIAPLLFCKVAPHSVQDIPGIFYTDPLFPIDIPE